MSFKNLITDNLHTMQIKAETLIPKSSYLVNGGVATYGLFTLEQWAVVIGAILGIATFIVNFYFQKRRDKRERELHNRRLEALKPNSKADERPHSE